MIHHVERIKLFLIQKFHFFGKNINHRSLDGLLHLVKKICDSWPELVGPADYCHKTQISSYYSRLSLSRLWLSRITAYLKEKIWSFFKVVITTDLGQRQKSA